MNRILPFLLAALLAPCGLPATECFRASLTERNPFGTADVRSAEGKGPLELHGFFSAGGDLMVSLTENGTGKSSWVAVGDPGAKWPVISADPEAGTAEVRCDDRIVRLTLAKESRGSTIVLVSTGGGAPVAGPMSEAGRTIMREALAAGLERARGEHPEWFDGNVIDEAARMARDRYMREIHLAAKKAVAEVSAEDARRMPAAAPFAEG